MEDKISIFEKEIFNISEHFSIVSFDNLSIVQLKMKQKVYNYETLYMGDDGEFTMYIDLVKEEFSLSSCSNIRFKMEYDIVSMFNKVKSANIVYHIKYYLLHMNKKQILIATLKEDNNYTFIFDDENKKWQFVGKLDDLIDSTYYLEELTKNEAIMISFGEFVCYKYEEMFNFKIEEE